MLDIGRIQTLLADRNAAEVARRTGLHINTVRKIRLGEYKQNVTFRTLKALSDYLEGQMNGGVAEYERRKAEWIRANPEASPIEYEAAILRICREVGI